MRLRIPSRSDWRVTPSATFPDSECEIRIQIKSHGGQSETGGVGSRHASGLGDEGWRRACDSKKGKNAGRRKWGQNSRLSKRGQRHKRNE